MILLGVRFAVTRRDITFGTQDYVACMVYCIHVSVLLHVVFRTLV